jgi:hypothetical protein
MIPQQMDQWQMPGVCDILWPEVPEQRNNITGSGRMASISPIKLKIPSQDLQQFSHFQLDDAAAREWAQGLPVTNIQSVVQQLRCVLSDLNRVKVSPEKRYSIIEALQPNLEVSLSNLARRYLNQPLVMPEEPRQMAEVADSLLTLATTAYTIVAIETIQQQESIQNTNPARLACEAIQRALALHGRKILQMFQLYRPVELHGWLTLHQLYALAEGQSLESLHIGDTHGGANTISGTYLQALILGCCKPNQLRQSDLAAIYRGLQEWHSWVTLHRPAKAQGMFMVNLDSDQPPLYSSLYEESPGPLCRFIDTDLLVEQLKQLREGDGRQGISFDQDTRLPPNMLDHLVTSLGSMSLRNFSRASTPHSLWVSIGLSSAHFHLAGERMFEQLLYGIDYIPPASDRVATNPFLQPQEKRDLWAQANPEEDYSSPEDELQISNGAAEVAHQIDVDEATFAELVNDEDLQLSPEERYPIFKVQMANASPGGYCLEWNADLPGDTRTGDIVSLKEGQSQEWVIAVIRWISQLENSRTLVGLELLSPRAKSYGAQIHRKTGEKTAPMRVLLLPEIKLVGQPHTLITPRAGFKERQKITLIREGEEYFIQLLRLVTTTGSFAQFDFRYIKQLGDVLGEDRHGSHHGSFDSLWSKI